jgi:hypothetical protein
MNGRLFVSIYWSIFKQCTKNITRIIKSGRMRWARHVAHMGRRRMHVRSWWERQKKRDHYKHLDVNGRIGTSGGLRKKTTRKTTT